MGRRDWSVQVTCSNDDECIELCNALTTLLENQGQISKLVDPDGYDLGEAIDTINQYLKFRA